MTTVTIPAPSAELQAFGDAFSAFMRATRRARGRYAAEHSGPGDLTLSQYHLLDALLDSDGQPLTVSELALSAGVASPTATRMLTGLEEQQLVVRERAQEGDRRCVRIALTDDGRARLMAKREHVADWRAQVFASLSPAERAQAARLLSQLATAVEDL